MEDEKSKFDRDNTLIWVCVCLMVMVSIQLYFTLQFKETIKKQETEILQLKKTIVECQTSETDEFIQAEREANKLDQIEMKKNLEIFKKLK